VDNATKQIFRSSTIMNLTDWRKNTEGVSYKKCIQNFIKSENKEGLNDYIDRSNLIFMDAKEIFF
jgi:hypothetical protein